MYVYIYIPMQRLSTSARRSAPVVFVTCVFVSCWTTKHTPIRIITDGLFQVFELYFKFPIWYRKLLKAISQPSIFFANRNTVWEHGNGIFCHVHHLYWSALCASKRINVYPCVLPDYQGMMHTFLNTKCFKPETEVGDAEVTNVLSWTQGLQQWGKNWMSKLQA